MSGPINQLAYDENLNEVAEIGSEVEEIEVGTVIPAMKEQSNSCHNVSGDEHKDFNFFDGCRQYQNASSWKGCG